MRSFSRLSEHLGALLLSRYNNSIVAMLKAEFPKHKWSPWKFTHSKRKYHEMAKGIRDNDPIALAELKRFMSELAPQIQAENPQDWIKQAKNLPPSQLYALSALGGLEFVLSKLGHLSSSAIEPTEREQMSALHRFRALSRLLEAKDGKVFVEGDQTNDQVEKLYQATYYHVLTHFGSMLDPISRLTNY